MVNETTEIDRGAKEIMKRLAQVNNSFVTIGVHEEAGNYPASGESEAPLIGAVAFWNEYGTKTAPERSFMRSAVDENRSSLRRETEKMKDDVLSFKRTPENALNRIGFRVQELIRGKIESLRTPPNAPTTIAGKPETGDNPLIDSRLMKRSINYEVTIK